MIAVFLPQEKAQSIQMVAATAIQIDRFIKQVSSEYSETGETTERKNSFAILGSNSFEI